eukprot:tig00020554_g10836.t1
MDESDENDRRVRISSTDLDRSPRERENRSPGAESDSSFERWLAQPAKSGSDIESSRDLETSSEQVDQPPAAAARIPAAIREVEERSDSDGEPDVPRVASAPSAGPSLTVPLIRTTSASPSNPSPAPTPQPLSAARASPAVQAASPAVRASPAAAFLAAASPAPAASASPAPPTLASAASAPASASPSLFAARAAFTTSLHSPFHPAPHLAPPAPGPSTSPAPGPAATTTASPAPPLQRTTVPLRVLPPSPTFPVSAAQAAIAAGPPTAFPFRVVTPAGSHAPSPAPPAPSPAPSAPAPSVHPHSHSGTPIQTAAPVPATAVAAGSVRPLFPGHRVALVAGSTGRTVETRSARPRRPGPAPAPGAPPPAPVRAFHIDLPERPPAPPAAPAVEPRIRSPAGPVRTPAPAPALPVERIRVPVTSPLDAAAGPGPPEPEAGGAIEDLVLRLALAAALEDLYPPGTTCVLAPPSRPAAPRFRPRAPVTSMALNYGAPIVKPSAADLERPSLGLHGRLPTAPADSDFLVVPRAPVVHTPSQQPTPFSVPRPTVDRGDLADRYSRLLGGPDGLAEPLEAFIYEQRRVLLASRAPGEAPAPPAALDAALRDTVSEVLRTREVSGLICAAAARRLPARP